MEHSQISQIRNIVGVSFKLLKDLGPFKEGEIVICFAQKGDYLWILLPRDWCGVRQIKLNVRLKGILKPIGN